MPVETLDELLATLDREGLLVNNDVRLPSVVAIVAGGPIRGSWWGHPKGPEIYAVLKRLSEHPDILSTKLISGKETFAHRRLWPEIYAIGRERATWQTDRLDAESRRLLARVDAEGTVLASGAPAALLEHLLLVHGESATGNDGIPRTKLRTWKAWLESEGCELEEVEPLEARDVVTDIVESLNDDYRGRAKLPWK